MAVRLAQRPRRRTDTRCVTFVNVGYWAPTVDSVLVSASLDPTLALQTTTGSRFTLLTLFDFILAQFSKIGITFRQGTVEVQRSITIHDQATG